MTTSHALTIRPARPDDVATILSMITELAEFEKLAHLVVADQSLLQDALFGDRPACECILGCENGADGEAVTFALYFHNFSTFLGRKGLYLEDLYVRPQARRRGHAKRMLAHLAALALARDCGRFEWSVLDWNVNAIGFYEGLGADVMPDWRICRLTGAPLAALASKD
jgi:GNAT superfamily N-acetyltransferase